MTVPGLKIWFAWSLRAYTRSLQVTLGPMAIFWAEGYKYPSIPLQLPLLPFDKLNTFPSLERALSLLFLHSSVIPLRDLSEKQARARIRASELHSHLLSTWFCQARGFMFVTLGALCS